jgi:NAD+ dependent glucose-6-phosphate dehydrogenase
MARTVLIAGAAGNIGTKLRRHFETLGWTLRLLDVVDGGDAAIQAADLAVWDEAWVSAFAGVDAVVLLSGQPSPSASWAPIQRLNLDLTLNVYEAAARQGAKRLIFASSNWVMAGHRFSPGLLTTDRDPQPVNPYGASKLFGERLGRSYSERWGLSVICFRIGYCQREDNRPGRQMGWGAWGQGMWLSDRDLAQGYEKAVLAPDHVRFAVLNLMSANPGMPWDLEETRRLIGYEPVDGHRPDVSAEQQLGAEATRQTRALMDSAEAWLANTRW